MVSSDFFSVPNPITTYWRAAMQYVKYLFSLHFEHFCNVMNGVHRTHSKYSFLLHMQISSFIIYAVIQGFIKSKLIHTIEGTILNLFTLRLQYLTLNSQLSVWSWFMINICGFFLQIYNSTYLFKLGCISNKQAYQKTLQAAKYFPQIFNPFSPSKLNSMTQRSPITQLRFSLGLLQKTFLCFFYWTSAQQSTSPFGTFCCSALN